MKFEKNDFTSNKNRFIWIFGTPGQVYKIHVVYCLALKWICSLQNHFLKGFLPKKKQTD